MLACGGLAACGGSPSKPDAKGDASAATDAADAGGRPDVAGDVASADGGGEDLAITPDAVADSAADARVEAPDAMADAGSDLVDAGTEAAAPLPGTPFRALAIATGALHNCALLDNHGVKCWGNNDYGQLGYGDRRERGRLASDMGDALPFVDVGTGRTVTTIAAGRYHTCALLDDGAVKCWGLAGHQGVDPGPLFDNSIGDSAGEMGDALRAADLGAGRRAVQLASGYAASCALLDDGSVRCWGQAQPVLPTAVPLGSTQKVRKLVAAQYGVLAIFEDGKVSDVLPHGSFTITPSDKVLDVAGARAGLCFILASGIAQCTHANIQPPPTTSLTAMGLNEFASQACAILTTGDVRCWGGGSNGCQEAIPGSNYWCSGPRGADNAFAVALGQRATALGAGALWHICALLADGGVKCWSTIDNCQFDNGTPIGCPVPEQNKLDANLGASVEIVTTAGKRSFGAWRPLDFGKHP